ncbi:hypothetical protein ACFU8Q_40600, partial [Streptomyces sp. NPDC057543]|uniref:hypothetical protein n=1 Tax=Streptomyces sp. NPDC057543 TaxID=3346163 RepID=UPI0036A0A10F
PQLGAPPGRRGVGPAGDCRHGTGPARPRAVTPLPGPPPGNAPPRPGPATSARRGRTREARQFVVAVLLAVLTVIGGAPAAAGSALPARPFAGVPPSAASSPGAHQPTLHSDRTARTGTAHDTHRTHIRTATATDGPVPTPPPRPRAGADHARTAHHLPPPGPDILLPGAPGIRVPHQAHRQTPAAPSRATDRFRVTLPGVRGPPRTAVHRPPVLPPVPSHTHAVPSPPR